MTNAAILFALLAQVALTLSLYPLLLKRKKAARTAGLVDEQRAPLDDNAWPDPVRQVNNCISNQFASPMLFYVLLLTLFITASVNLLTLVLAWAYVASRAAHAWVHVHSNYVPLRRNLFAGGLLMLIALAMQLFIALL